MIELELPCGIQQTDGTWTKNIVLDEMTGYEEDILTDQTRLTGGKGKYARSHAQRMTEILSRCTVKIGNETRPEGKNRRNYPQCFEHHWHKAFNADRGFAIIALRVLSLGSKFKFDHPCPECGKQIDGITAELQEYLETHTRRIDLEIVRKDFHTVRLPRSGASVDWRFLKGKDEPLIEEISNHRKADILTALMQMRIESVNDRPAAQGVLDLDTGKPVPVNEFLSMLPSGDRDFLRAQFDAVEGGVNTDIDIVCDNDDCGREFKMKLPVGKKSFFFPSAT